MKKRMCSVILTIIMICSSFSLVAFSANSPVYSLQNKTVTVGETFNIDVAISNNPGIISLRFKVVYDTTSLELLEVKNTEMLNGYTTPSPTISSPYTLRWADALATTNNFANGTVVTLKFKALKTASTNIQIQHEEARTYMGEKVAFSNGSATITVNNAPVAVTGVSLNTQALSLKTGESKTLVATVSPSTATNKAVEWRSTNSLIATVDSNGVVTGRTKGTTTISAITVDGKYTATCTVNVSCSHSNTKVVQAVESTCLIQGNNQYTVCEDCGDVINGSDAKLPLAEHKGGTATCQSLAICSVCKNAYGEYGTCVYDAKWSFDDFEHWHECIVCHGKSDADTHIYTNDRDIDCNICSKEKVETTTLGDVNLDGYVDNLDAAMVLKYDAGIINLSENQMPAADVNSDGSCDNLDAAMILKYDAGIIPEL